MDIEGSSKNLPAITILECKLEVTDDENTEPGDATVDLESEMVVEDEDGNIIPLDNGCHSLKREKPDEDSSCSAETSAESEAGPSKSLRIVSVKNEPFLNDASWEEETVTGREGVRVIPFLMGAKRRPNFTHGELDALVHDMDHVLQLQQQGATWLQLQEAWDNTAKHVNNVGHHRRSSREIKAKWRDLKSKVKCKATSRNSGWRNHTVSLTSLEKKVLSVLNKNRGGPPMRPVSVPTRSSSRVTNETTKTVEPQIQTIVIEPPPRQTLLIQKKICVDTNSNNGNAKEWLGWEAQTAERNAELVNRRATVPGQAAELAELSAEVAETGVWLATKRNEIAERSLALQERRTLVWENFVQLLVDSV